MREEIELLSEEDGQEETPALSISAPVLLSIVVHGLLVLILVRTYHPVRPDDRPLPITRYVELIRQEPRPFTEAPGPKVGKAPLNALWSDANRKASSPNLRNGRRSQRPGSGGSYSPPASSSQRAPALAEEQSASLPPDLAATPIPALRTSQASAAQVNWHSAIKEVGKVASLGGGQNLDLSKLGGDGGKGFAEQGPLSFETQWYDWGEYAQSMVAKIRIHWYGNMPPLIRTGMKGVVTIRFTIQRDGRITDIEMLDSSTVPPYDFAARKAIELSSPLNALPRDFPKNSERVTCMFFYNSEPPGK